MSSERKIDMFSRREAKDIGNGAEPRGEVPKLDYFGMVPRVLSEINFGNLEVGGTGWSRDFRDKLGDAMHERIEDAYNGLSPRERAWMKQSLEEYRPDMPYSDSSVLRNLYSGANTGASVLAATASTLRMRRGIEPLSEWVVDDSLMRVPEQLMRTDTNTIASETRRFPSRKSDNETFLPHDYLMNGLGLFVPKGIAEKHVAAQPPQIGCPFGFDRQAVAGLRGVVKRESIDRGVVLIAPPSIY